MASCADSMIVGEASTVTLNFHTANRPPNAKRVIRRLRPIHIKSTHTAD